MSLQILSAKLCLWLGVIGLFVTVTLHLTLGLPPLEAAIANGHITKAPGMSPNELLGIWIAFSAIFYVLIAGFFLERLVKKQPSLLFAGSLGGSAIACAIVMNTLIPEGHIAFPLLLTPGILIVAGTAIEHLALD